MNMFFSEIIVLLNTIVENQIAADSYIVNYKASAISCLSDGSTEIAVTVYLASAVSLRSGGAFRVCGRLFILTSTIFLPLAHEEH